MSAAAIRSRGAKRFDAYGDVIRKAQNTAIGKAGSDSLVETFENVTIVTTFNGAPQPAVPRRKSGIKYKRSTNDISGREYCLWAYLKELKECVDWTAGGTDRRTAGLLWVGSSRRLIDMEAGRETDPRIMRACMRNVVSSASEAEIAEFADFACRTGPREPDPYIIGRDLLYLQHEWHAAREPRRIWPYGRSREWVEAFFAAKDRARERERGRRRRKAAGAIPREESLSSVARAIGRDRKTIRQHLKRAGLDWSDVRQMATEANIEVLNFVRSLIESDSIVRRRSKMGKPERPRREPRGRESENQRRT